MVEEKVPAEEIPEAKEEITEEKLEISFFDKIKIHKFKILGGILGIFVLAGAVFGAYRLRQRQVQPVPQPTPIVTSTPGPTANWKTYTNTKYGYSIKFPPDWQQGIEIAGFTKNGYSLTISLGPLELSRPPNITITTSKVKVGDRDYLKSTWKLPDDRVDFERIDLGVEVKEGKLEIVLRYKNSVYSEEYDQIFNLMLSTFRFLPSTGSGQGEEESCIKTETGEEMTLAEAREIVLKSRCVKEGNLTDKYSCNQYTGTWWIDLDIEKPGCAPACVIDVSTKKAEINWRCTGFIPSEGKVFCKEPRPQFCTMECIVNPPYICGSDGKSYCSECQACANPKVKWYLIQDEPCGVE